LVPLHRSRYLRPEGENVVGVEVYRNSDGSFLEAQDMFRLPGIFRSVYLTAKPRIHVKDLRLIPDLSPDLREGTLRISADLDSKWVKAIQKDLLLRYTLSRVALYSDEVDPVAVGSVEARTSAPATATTELKISMPQLWSAELPHRYVLVAELFDKSGKRLLDRASTYTGFRKVEIKDTPAGEDEFGRAGRYFYVNGKPVKLRGVNRHETNPSTGHAVSHQQMEREVFLMKRANINHVRNSHYPADPYWYYLCDKYGIYLEDEANVESHEYYYGKASLSHVPEFEAQHVSRMLEMVHAHINHPSIVIWSLGNEAGPGINFTKSYEATKRIVGLLSERSDIVPSAELRIDLFICQGCKTAVGRRREKGQNVKSSDGSVQIAVEHMSEIFQVVSHAAGIGNEHNLVCDFLRHKSPPYSK